MKGKRFEIVISIFKLSVRIIIKISKLVPQSSIPIVESDKVAFPELTQDHDALCIFDDFLCVRGLQCSPKVRRNRTIDIVLFAFVPTGTSNSEQQNKHGTQESYHLFISSFTPIDCVTFMDGSRALFACECWHLLD